MAIEYTNIFYEEYRKLSDEEKKAKPYCIEYDSGGKDWVVNGKSHREDGPAVIFDNGAKFWYLNHVNYSFEKWCNELNKSDEEKIFLKLKYI